MSGEATEPGGVITDLGSANYFLHLGVTGFGAQALFEPPFLLPPLLFDPPLCEPPLVLHLADPPFLLPPLLLDPPLWLPPLCDPPL